MNRILPFIVKNLLLHWNKMVHFCCNLLTRLQEWYCENFGDHTFTVILFIIPFFISWWGSYNSHRRTLCESVVNPAKQVLGKKESYDQKYEELRKISDDCSVKYFSKKECLVFRTLLQSYSNVKDLYPKPLLVDVQCLIDFFIKRIEEEHIQTRIYPITLGEEYGEDFGTVIDYDYPPDMLQNLHLQLKRVLESYDEFRNIYGINQYQKAIEEIFCSCFIDYYKNNNNTKTISFFGNTTLQNVVEKSEKHKQINAELKLAVDALEQSKEQFLKLRIAK